MNAILWLSLRPKFLLTLSSKREVDPLIVSFTTKMDIVLAAARRAPACEIARHFTFSHRALSLVPGVLVDSCIGAISTAIGLNECGASVLKSRDNRIGIQNNFTELTLANPHKTPVSRVHRDPQGFFLCPATCPGRRRYPRACIRLRCRRNQLESSSVHLVTLQSWKHHAAPR